MRLRLTGLALALAMGTLPFVWLVPASAQCAAPELEVTPSSGSVGQTILLEGRYYFDACGDYVICTLVTPSPAPTSTASPTPTPSPTQKCQGPDVAPELGIRLDLLQGDRVWHFGKIDARFNGKFAKHIEIPADAVPGAATFRVVPPGCSESGCRQRIGFTILEGLPTSGLDLRPFVAVGSGGVVLGIVLMMLSPRGRHAAR